MVHYSTDANACNDDYIPFNRNEASLKQNKQIIRFSLSFSFSIFHPLNSAKFHLNEILFRIEIENVCCCFFFNSEFTAKITIQVKASERLWTLLVIVSLRFVTFSRGFLFCFHCSLSLTQRFPWKFDYDNSIFWWAFHSFSVAFERKIYTTFLFFFFSFFFFYFHLCKFLICVKRILIIAVPLIKCNTYRQ